MNNKENILTTALDLFATHGYQAVSVRDICGQLGLKESALYYHFKNKKALLDVLYGQVDSLITTMTNQFDVAFSKVTEVSNHAMCQVAVGLLVNYLCNPTVLKLISMLSIERMSDLEAARNYQRLVFDLPLQQSTDIFQQMMDSNMIRVGDATRIANEYYSIIYTVFQQHCIGIHDDNNHMAIAMEKVYRQIDDFYTRIK